MSLFVLENYCRALRPIARLRLLVVPAAAAVASTLVGFASVSAQTTPAACQPPRSQEYLLLIVSETPESQAQVRRILPDDAEMQVCRYLNNTVTRVGGFPNLDVANSWARYVQDIGGMPTFVAQPNVATPPRASQPTTAANPVIPPQAQPTPALPPSSPPANQPQGPQPVVSVPPPQRQPASIAQPATIPPARRSTAQPGAPVIPGPRSQPATQATAQPAAPQASSSFRIPAGETPKPLGAGYAVLVDYFNKPEVATQIQQLMGREIGLVSYRQRPYLVVAHTSNQGEASLILKELANRGFWSMIVDGRRAVLLGPVKSAATAANR